MTTPDERTRALVQSGAFLKDLRADLTLPESIRAEAHRLLRHYPSTGDLRHIAMAIGAHPWVQLLSTEHDPDWLRGYRHGAHEDG